MQLDRRAKKYFGLPFSKIAIAYRKAVSFQLLAIS
jgi:hypothetical protein